MCTNSHTDTHTRTRMHAVSVSRACMLITHLPSLSNVYHILSHSQTLFKGTLKCFVSVYTHRHMQTWSSSMVCCELVLWGFEGGPRKELELCCGFTHMSPLWRLLMTGPLLKPHWCRIPTLVSACSYACCASVTKNGLLYLWFKKCFTKSVS